MQTLSERFSHEELEGCYGILEEAEALLQRGNESSVPENKTEKTGDIRLGKKQESALEQWAKQNNVWIPNVTKILADQFGEPFGEGGEALVYRKDDNTVVKAINLAYYIEPQLLLDRIVLHNTISPDTPLTVTHFGRKENREFVVVVEQPYVRGEAVTQDEISKFMGTLGFIQYGIRKTDYINAETGVLADDIHDENVIKDLNGFYHIIDGDFRLNTANYNIQGKKRTTKGNNQEVPAKSQADSTASNLQS